MDIFARQLRDADRPAATILLDDVVGRGFWDLADAEGELSFVAVTGKRLAGVLLARLAPAGDPDARLALESMTAQVGTGRDPLLHVRELAVSPLARRGGAASHLLARAEADAYARGARGAFAFGWLPAGRPEPESVPFYEAHGYTPGVDVAGFFAQNSLESGARCPYCGAPPCRCAVRPFVKRLTGTTV